MKLRIFFWQDGMIYRYDTELSADSTFGNKATFVNQSIYQKKYYKTKVNEIFDDEGFVQLTELGDLPRGHIKGILYIKKEKYCSSVF